MNQKGVDMEINKTCDDSDSSQIKYEIPDNDDDSDEENKIVLPENNKKAA